MKDQELIITNNGTEPCRPLFQRRCHHETIHVGL